MPLYIDIHDITGATPEAIAQAHLADLACQDKHGVSFIKYWLNESKAKVFCLCSAPDAAAAQRVHTEATGQPADRIIEVDADLVDSLLGGGNVAPSGAVMCTAPDRCDPGVRTIMFTDIVGSTALTQRLGDRAAMKILEIHDGVVRDALRAFSGREVKHLGDGIMAAFILASDAVRCASSIQAALRDPARSAGAIEPVTIRIGVAAGEPVERHGDFFGSTVQLAARLCSHARPGQTLVSDTVTSLCGDLRFDDLGQVTLKGFEQPTRAYAVPD